MSAPYPPPAAAPSNDRTTLWGVLGIVIGLICCWPLGLLFAFLSFRDARRFGKQPTLAYIAFAACAIGIIWNIIYAANR
ncbi:hypothetical protein RB614_01850 [Phytohabitans sp. ZYX-F-186]|uniref:DUF4190 domain-containing protein n=1 Tax=Phytohabitans maris TaxID=3071409 RepID=A0ABU0Z8D6_9ACTN|nr:hypothetical protein [Phytohabitans sp. ZYX-F-186]MDQ7903263.1 hypothetical protein [Phytohabitans sp. ZYX-F-186]